MKHSMKNRQMKAAISTLLAVILLLCTTFPANAADIVPDTSIHLINQVTDADLHINGDVAYYIAEFFIRDMADNGFANWDKETRIEKITPMYDETGINVSSYTAELSKGYVVISAYIDMPNIILEWSDETLPVYQTFSSEKGKIVYTGTLSYYFDSGEETLQTIDGNRISRSDIVNKDSKLRSVDNVPSQVMKTILASHDDSSPSTGYSVNSNGENDIITDARIYAGNVYGGVWENYGYQNKWESYVNYAITTSFSGYANNCGPVAITNAIKMYGNRYNKSTIKNSSNLTIYNKVIQVNKENNETYYTNYDGTGGGTDPLKVHVFIEKSFTKCGGSATVFDDPYRCTVDNINSSTGSNTLMYVGLKEYKPYDNHAVIGFAWSALTRKSDGKVYYFLKVADGQSSGGRYLDVERLNDKSNPQTFRKIIF